MAGQEMAMINKSLLLSRSGQFDKLKTNTNQCNDGQRKVVVIFIWETDCSDNNNRDAHPHLR